MKKITILLLFFISSFPFFAQRPLEKLDRSVVAQKLTNGVYVNWRITSDEWYNTTYKLYRDGVLIYTTPANGASNYLDASGTLTSKYSVSAVHNGVEAAQSAAVGVLSKSYIEIPVRDIKSLGKTAYYLNDATAADLDGDGQYEIIIKRMNRDWSVSNTNYTYFEAYKLDGTFMWAIDVGPNITMDVEINIAAYDFDGDGKAEVYMRSSDNTVFGLDKFNQNGTSVGDRDGDGVTNYRAYIGGDGFMNAGPEYLSLIDGVTGKELDWVNFIPRGSSSDWGDGYGHRANKFFFGAPYLDGLKPSLFIGRGIYTMTKMQTYDVVNKKLIKRWYWECTSPTALQQGKWDDSPKSYFSQGYHNYTIADVDDDGKDEINWGSMTIDDDGNPLYSTELGHGDAQHYGDFDPYRKGQEVFACNEEKPGTNLRDAKTGKLLYRRVTASDCGRCCVGNITDTYKGAEAWGGSVGLSCTDRVEMTHFGLAESNCIYWDGDLLQEVCDHSGFSTTTGVGYGTITKFNGFGNISTLLTADSYSCNYTKGTPCLQADIIGDWREEAIWWRNDSLALRIYTTPYSTTNRIYTLMHDHQYRQAICWQMCGYNQPPHTSFYLGGDFPTPIPAKSTNGKLIWQGNSSVWDSGTANFTDGNDLAGQIAHSSPAIAFSNGKSVLLDSHATNKTLNLNASIEPELLMIAGNDDYTINGSGTMGGSMILDKTGECSLYINGNHTYSGNTTVWEGNLWLNGSLLNSPVIVRRHANFGGKMTVGKNIFTEYNAAVFIGGQNVADTLKVTGNLNLVTGAKLVFDLSDNATTFSGSHGVTSNKKNDFLEINGTLQIGTGSVILLNLISDSLSLGKYRLMKVNAISGTLSTVKIQGTEGRSVELSYDTNTKELFLVVNGTRNASSIVWSGSVDANWNIAKTANWKNDNSADVFVSNDSVYFDDNGLNRTITISDSLKVSLINFNSKNNYTIGGTGVLTGTADLIKSGVGALNLNTRNSFSGKTTVNGGYLIMQYAPSPTSNGGIGLNNTDPSYLVLRDSAIMQVTTANEQTNRGLTLEGSAGGLLSVPSALYWNGNIIGTKLTKFGSGTLYVGNNNTGLTETVLKAGTIKLNSDASVPYGIGKKITLLGGTLETLNSVGSYLSSSNNFDVPSGFTATVIAGARCEYNGILTGAGTLNWSCDYIRAYINGNWSAFNGTLNITKNAANSTYEDHFIFNNSNGLPYANVVISSGVKMCYKNGTADNGTTTIKVGLLGGAGEFYNAGLEVGSSNSNGTFTGTITGTTAVKKVGTGIWTLTGANTYTGTTTVSAGTMTVSGSLSTGTVTVQSDALMNLSGTIAGSAVINSGATINLTGTITGLLANSGTLYGTGTVTGNATLSGNSTTAPANTSIGTLNFKGNLSISSGAILNMQISGTSNADKLAVTGVLTCAGVLNVALLGVTPTTECTYQLFTAGSYSGTFATVNLPALGQTLEWDLSELYTAGKIKTKITTALKNPESAILIKQNPSNGKFILSSAVMLKNTALVVADMNGKVIMNKVAAEIFGDELIDVSNEPDGMYMLTVKSDEFNSTFKLIKK